MNFQKIIQFIKYHNAFTIAVVLVFVFSASVFASPAIREVAFGKTMVEQNGIDNSALLSVDLDNFNFGIRIDNVSKDEENYYVSYTYESLGIKDNVWQKIRRAETMTIPKSVLGSKDLGLYITEELGETVDSELAYLKEVQEKQKQRGQTFVQETTKYTGMIGLILDSSTKVLSGYEPVVKPVKRDSAEQVQTEDEEEDNIVVYYYDGDKDGYGSRFNMQSGYSQPNGYVPNKGDCNDLVANINPGIAEVCDDGLDNDCDEKIDLADEDCQSSEQGTTNSEQEEAVILGCMNETAMNYNADATEDDGTCEYTESEPEEPEDIYGCMDVVALNYNLSATIDDGTCEYPEPDLPDDDAVDTTTPPVEPEAILGCMDETAMNYNADATEDNGSCEYAIEGCMDIEAINYNIDANTDDGTCEYNIYGCMDVVALNYNLAATIDDGTCEYPEPDLPDD
ncbi:MAG: MopE-related protein, partial [Thermodesulfobacteriota bacterium]|nr:MopE-related protein [Thermodesulfobacteriota bacterium]